LIILKKLWVMVMPKRRSESELLREGCHSYHKALFAVMQFRREVQEAIRAAVDERIDEIVTAMGLNKAEVSEGLTLYAKPANLAQTWDGADAEVGLRYPGKPWETRWGIWFYFAIEDDEEGGVLAYAWFKEPGAPINKLASLGVEGLEATDSEIWIWKPVGEAADGFTSAVHRVLDGWIEIWQKAGGIQQFLPPRKVGKTQDRK
jgi:hypothetical protein